MSDDLDGWGGAEFVLAADRLDTPDVIEAAWSATSELISPLATYLAYRPSS